MEIKKFEKIVFAKKDWETLPELFDRIGEQLKLLLNAGYIATVRYDEPNLGIVVIEFEHDEHHEPWGCANPMWITVEDADKILKLEEREKLYVDGATDSEV